MLLLLQSEITPWIHTQGVAAIAPGYVLVALSGRACSDRCDNIFSGRA